MPMVMRTPYGAGVKALEHHSESTESLYVQIPGLKVVVPSSPREAKGLLISAVRTLTPWCSSNPPVPTGCSRRRLRAPRSPSLGRARTVQPGSDVTVVGWGAMMPLIAKAAEPPAQRDKLRGDRPEDALAYGQRRGGELCAQDRALRHRPRGPQDLRRGGGLIARINEEALLSLEAPVVRVTAPDMWCRSPRESIIIISTRTGYTTR